MTQKCCSFTPARKEKSREKLNAQQNQCHVLLWLQKKTGKAPVLH
jgi:hypothetical protein